MPKPHETALRLTRNLRNPRPGVAIYEEYNTLRQQYILNTAAAHFEKRDDDPAPLYGKTLLDVGCGESTIGEFLALSGADITAVDPNAEALDNARTSAETFGAPISFVQARAEDLIQNPTRFDVILVLDVLEDVEDPAKLIWVVKQLLAPGGIVVFSCINRTWLAWFFHIILSSYVYRRTAVGSRRYNRFHTPEQLAEICSKSGLEIFHIQGMRFSPSKLKWKFCAKPRTRFLAAALAPEKNS